MSTRGQADESGQEACKRAKGKWPAFFATAACFAKESMKVPVHPALPTPIAKFGSM
jgi:hypothetical protein